jgi:hypothetical protein
MQVIPPPDRLRREVPTIKKAQGCIFIMYIMLGYFEGLNGTRSSGELHESFLHEILNR